MTRAGGCSAMARAGGECSTVLHMVNLPAYRVQLLLVLTVAVVLSMEQMPQKDISPSSVRSV